jgi:hypothetical protein
VKTIKKLNIKAQKEIEKAKERFGAAFNEQEFITTNPRVVEYPTFNWDSDRNTFAITDAVNLKTNVTSINSLDGNWVH